MYCVSKCVPYMPATQMTETLVMVLTGKRRNSLKVTAYKEIIRVLARYVYIRQHSQHSHNTLNSPQPTHSAPHGDGASWVEETRVAQGCPYCDCAACSVVPGEGNRRGNRMGNPEKLPHYPFEECWGIYSFPYLELLKNNASLNKSLKWPCWVSYQIQVSLRSLFSSIRYLIWKLRW